MEMAEKDNSEGRCPACRAPYNKEKIVATSCRYDIPQNSHFLFSVLVLADAFKKCGHTG